MCKELCPRSFWMCDEADTYCMSSSPPYRQEQNCCGPRGEYCCIECFYCLSPIALVFDILCVPLTLYNCNLAKTEASAI